MSFKSLLAIAALLIAPVTQAAYVTINEAGMDGVFSQASFGQTPIDIRIGAVTQFVRPTLLDISSDAEIDQVFNLHVGDKNIVNFYFVDTISACGLIDAGIIGCGELPGNNFVVESDWAANTAIPPGGNITTGVNILAHELGHNLGLSHRFGNNLMNGFVTGFQDLNFAEVADIRVSPLVQHDANGFFIMINPVLIVAAATAVPEPSTIFLVLVGLVAVGSWTRVRSGRV